MLQRRRGSWLAHGREEPLSSESLRQPLGALAFLTTPHIQCSTRRVTPNCKLGDSAPSRRRSAIRQPH